MAQKNWYCHHTGVFTPSSSLLACQQKLVPSSYCCAGLPAETGTVIILVFLLQKFSVLVCQQKLVPSSYCWFTPASSALVCQQKLVPSSYWCFAPASSVLACQQKLVPSSYWWFTPASSTLTCQQKLVPSSYWRFTPASSVLARQQKLVPSSYWWFYSKVLCTGLPAETGIVIILVFCSSIFCTGLPAETVTVTILVFLLRHPLYWPASRNWYRHHTGGFTPASSVLVCQQKLVTSSYWCFAPASSTLTCQQKLLPSSYWCFYSNILCTGLPAETGTVIMLMFLLRHPLYWPASRNWYRHHVDVFTQTSSVLACQQKISNNNSKDKGR